MESALEPLVFGTPLRRLYFDRVETRRAAIIGAGPHVELARVEREFEAAPHEFAPHPWHALAAELVKVHVGVEAAAFIFYAGLFGGRS